MAVFDCLISTSEKLNVSFHVVVPVIGLTYHGTDRLVTVIVTGQLVTTTFLVP